MRARAVLAALLFVPILSAVPHPSQAQDPQAIVPGSWEGIWQVEEETRDCTSGALLRTASFLDTLCAGEAFYLLPGQSLTPGGNVYATCDGPGFTDTSLDLTCSIPGICGCLGTCYSTTTKSAQWTRSGDVATFVMTATIEYSAPGGCAPPTVCERTTGTRTRIAPTAPECGHTIQASAGPNGSIDPSGTVTVPNLGSLTFTMTPDPGYAIASVLVDGSEIGPVASYPFTNVTSDHTIAASFALTMGFVFKPGKLHLDHHGRYVTGYFSPPAPYSANDIDVASVRLNGSVAPAPGTDATVGNKGLKVKFLRSELAPTLPFGNDVIITATGLIAGEPFTGTDLIDVRAPKVHLASTALVAGAPAEVGWDVADVPAASVTLLSTFDGGATWNIEAEAIPNTGRYTWMVPDVATGNARLSVIQIFATDETGLITESEFAVTDPFSISAPLDAGGRAPVFALRVANPAQDGLSVRFSLASGARATLAAYDVSGRRAALREVGGAAGWRTVDLGRLPAGIYVVRLTQGERSLSERIAVVR